MGRARTGGGPRHCAPAAPPVQGDSDAPAPAISAETCRRLRVAAGRLARRPADADDLVQEALLAAWRAGRFDLPWLIGTLRKQAALQARTSVRRRRREALAAEDAVADPADPAPVRAPSAAPDWLHRLPPAGRSVAVLALHGLSAEEIRWLLGITPAAFRQRLTGIRRTLKALAPAEHRALACMRDPARSVDLQFGLVRRALRAAMRGGGVGTHDGDGHLLVLRTRAHVPPPRGNG